MWYEVSRAIPATSDNDVRSQFFSDFLQASIRVLVVLGSLSGCAVYSRFAVVKEHFPQVSDADIFGFIFASLVCLLRRLAQTIMAKPLLSWGASGPACCHFGFLEEA